MRPLDWFWGAVSVAALLYGAVETVLGHLPLGLPCIVIGLLLLWTITPKRKS